MAGDRAQRVEDWCELCVAQVFGIRREPKSVDSVDSVETVEIVESVDAAPMVE